MAKPPLPPPALIQDAILGKWLYLLWKRILAAAGAGANDDITSMSAITGGIQTPEYIDFNTDAVAPADAVGRMTWNDGDGTLDLGLKGGNVVLQLGQEQLQMCFNDNGATLTDGTIVQITGAQGQRIAVNKAKADAEATSIHTLGMVTEPIAVGETGFVTNQGLVRHLDTTVDSEGNATTEGDTLYLSATVSGGWTRVRPTAPNHTVVVGFLVRKHATVGEIFVKVDNGYELNELHNVLITEPVANGSALVYDSVTGVWKNGTAGSGGSYHIDGGVANSVYTADQIIDGGGA